MKSEGLGKAIKKVEIFKNEGPAASITILGGLCGGCEEGVRPI